MPTVIAVRAAGGAVVAADRLATRDGRVRSRDRRRVFSFDGWLLGVASGDVDRVRDRLAVAVEEYRTERGYTPGIEPLGRLAAEVAGAADADLVVAARDDEGAARVAAVRADGSRLAESPIALGTGAELALGRLEAASFDAPVERAAETVREVLAGTAERDPETGETVDAATLDDE
ncbi:hypothetical protein GCM10027435_11320 [Haloparvum alkalitolerans]